jgi:DNA-binding CsgD family transcriptional regulator
MRQPKNLPESDILTVVTGHFDPLLSRGLHCVLSEDPSLLVLASGLTDTALEEAVTQRQPRLTIVGETIDYGLLARLKANQSALGVLVLARDPSRLSGTGLLELGVTCLDRTASIAGLSAAMRLTVDGAPSFVSADAGTVAGGASASLTPRETEVFSHLSRGRSYAAIGSVLHIAPETVRTHTLRICRKLNVPSKKDLIGMAVPSATCDAS